MIKAFLRSSLLLFPFSSHSTPSPSSSFNLPVFLSLLSNRFLSSFFCVVGFPIFPVSPFGLAVSRPSPTCPARIDGKLFQLPKSPGVIARRQSCFLVAYFIFLKSSTPGSF